MGVGLASNTMFDVVDVAVIAASLCVLVEDKFSDVVVSCIGRPAESERFEDADG